jgi:hypothetical protein
VGLCAHQNIRALDHGLEQGFELLLLPQQRAVRIQGSFQSQASFRLAEAEKAGAVLETEQGDLDGFGVHGIKVPQNHGSSM